MISDVIKGFLRKNAMEIVKRDFYYFIEDTKREIRNFEKRILKGIGSVVVIGIGLIYLLIAAVFLLIEFFQLSTTLSLVIVGILVILIGYLIMPRRNYG